MMFTAPRWWVVPRRLATLSSSYGRRDITSGYDLVGPYFPIEASITSSTLQEFVKAFTAYGFKVAIVLCDGASSNLTVLKILTGYEKKELPVNESADNLRDKFFLDVSFSNPEDPYGRPILTMICPSHQVVVVFVIKIFCKF